MTVEKSPAAIFPDEVARVEAAREGTTGWGGNESVIWGLGAGTLKVGDVVVAEVAPTLRCSENCSGCPDAISVTEHAIEIGTIPKIEPRASSAEMLERISELKNLGVKHIMNVGGTIDHLPELRTLIEHELEQGMVVSWFTDGIPQQGEDGQSSRLFEKNMASGWLLKVATHVSTDYTFGYSASESGDLLRPQLTLPPKKGRVGDFRADPEYSRVFKSQYGAAFMKRLIESQTRRVVANMTISKANHDQVAALYEQAARLQDYAEQIGSPTEVLFTFSPWVWRPHQARGDNLAEHSPDDGLGPDEMPAVNESLSKILEDTYARLASGRPRILANSSGYTSLHAERGFNDEAIWQDVGYPGGRPLILNINPTAKIMLDPMFDGPELGHVRSTFGYMDRTPDPDQNPFSDFHHNNRLYLPNMVALESRDDPAAQPRKIMDRRLARMVVKRGGIIFGANMKNKSDSPHTLGDPRVLGSHPFEIRYLAERILHIAQTNADDDDVLVGLATFGHGLASAASAISTETDRPMKNIYVKLVAEAHKGQQKVEGDIDLNDKGILVDDLIFHGTTTRGALEILKERGFNKPISHLIYVINRQLQRLDKGPSLEEEGHSVHSLITMAEIIQYMIQHGAITPEQLKDVTSDYQMHPRHELPDFAQPGYQLPAEMPKINSAI